MTRMFRMARTPGWWRRLWPGSLFGQLSVIVVAGGLAIQLLFSSIWYDVRYSQVLEVPARLVAFRTVETLHKLANGEAITHLGSETFHPELLASPLATPPRLDSGQQNVESMLQDALSQEVGEAVELSLLDVTIQDENGHARTWAGLFGLSHVVGHFDFQLRLASGQWLHIQAVQEQGWNAEPAWRVLGDYALRVYLLRALALAAIALIVVRISTRPLRRLVRAASALGQNIEQPPLPVEGPREMRQAAETFNAMQQQLIDLMGERTQLLAAVSHDLRTPLTRMRIRVEGINDARLREKLVTNIGQMEELIRSLLDSASSGATPDGHAAFDLAGLISEVVDEFVDTGGDVRWHGAPAVIISGHVASIRRVLHNLIDNALHYAGSAQLTLRLTERWVEVEIQDDGPGIHDQHLPAVMQPYVQGEASAPSSGIGYGLGLSIARSIVMAHRGRLALDNRTGGGLRVVMALPTHAGAKNE